MKLDDLPAELTAARKAQPPLPRAAAGFAHASAATAPSAAASGAAPVLSDTSEAAAVLALQALALRHVRFDAAATAVLAALAARLGSGRVSLVVRQGHNDRAPLKLLAHSQGVQADGRLAGVRAVLDAADEALASGAPIEYPPRAHADARHAIAHAALLRGDEVCAALSLPIDDPEHAPAVLVIEQRYPLSDKNVAFARDAALFAGPILLMKARIDAPWRDQLLRACQRRWARWGEQGLAPQALMVGTLTVGLAAALLWPTTHHVVAQARVEGLGQRIVSAPADGFLMTVLARPGENVVAGQVLATLDDREPQLELERFSAERAQLERQYRDALTRDDAGQIVALRAKFEHAQAQQALAQSHLERTLLRSPIDGVVLSGELAPSLGMPVKRGQELLLVAPAQAWRLVAEIDEQDVLAVQPGQSARVLFAALSGRSTAFDVTRVAPVATALDGRNIFEAEGHLTDAVDGLRPGLRGVARIEAGQRSPLGVWWERAMNWVRRAWWTWMA